jgi:multidrug efflux pump subunit AcrA (membrane-fusion protein)
MKLLNGFMPTSCSNLFLKTSTVQVLFVKTKASKMNIRLNTIIAILLATTTLANAQQTLDRLTSDKPLSDRALYDNPLGDVPSTPIPPGMIRAGNASIQCIHDIQVAAQSDGIIQRLMVDEGASVKKGAILLTIDDRVAQAEVAVAAKEWEASDKQAKETANVDFAKAASALSDKEFNMEADLFKKGSSTTSALERKKLEAQKARFGVAAQTVEHQKEILAAEVNREKHIAAKVRLQLHEVLAPYDGVIVRRHRDEGEWVRGGEPVFQLMHMNEMRVQALVPVKMLAQNGLTVSSLQDAPINIQVAISDKDMVTVNSKIDYVSPEIDSQKVRVWAKIANQAPNGSNWMFRKGMTAVVDINPIR